MNNLLEINNISKVYQTELNEIEAVHNISLSIKENEFVALIGPSGCGKSTILSMISELESISSGSIDKHCNISHMLQSDALFEWLTVYENTILGLKVMNSISKDKMDYVNELLKKYGLEEFKNSYPNELSGGMRQRVALIRTLALYPNLLLMDEPFSALDYQSRISITEDIKRILKEEKKSLMLVTHDISEAIIMCDRVVVLSNRPCSIKNIHDTSNINSRRDNAFFKMYDEIEKEIEYDN